MTLTTTGEDFADVLSLDGAPGGQAEPALAGGPPTTRPPTAVATDPGDGEPHDHGDEDPDIDHESVIVGQATSGVPVDPPDEPHATSPGASPARPPILPAWLASRAGLVATLTWWWKEARYHTLFHAVRAPKYAAKTAIYAPGGAVRAAGRLIRWASAEEGNWHLRQAAASGNDASAWLALEARRQRQARWRWPVLITGTVAALVALAGLVTVPDAGRWRLLVLAALVAACARAGRPADKPITDRVSQGKTYRKLTAELVRRALLSVQLSGINQAVAKDPGAISFPAEIHREGPGHLAIVDLPFRGGGR